MGNSFPARLLYFPSHACKVCSPLFHLVLQVHIRALHTRPDPALPEEECALKISLQPIRLNIDQVSSCFNSLHIPVFAYQFNCQTLINLSKTANQSHDITQTAYNIPVSDASVCTC